MPPYVRKQPLLERIKANLNIYDFALWLSEEIESNGWDQLEKEWAIPIGIAFNVIFLIARANINTRSRGYDEVFGASGSSGWAASIAWFFTQFLTLACLLNTFYTFFRKKHYRLFETPVDTVPSTPSARRVKLNSSPVSSSPLRYLSSLVGVDSAESRAHPDAKSDVWEVAVWDPLPLSLRLFCYFSPGHVILYWLFLPTLSSDPRPSTTVATTILLAFLISVQLSFLSTNFSQQNKDSAFISKEVLHEYDTKFVRPRTQPLYRDVATQFSEQASYSDMKEEQYNKVVVFTPTFITTRGFKTNPNPNYRQQSDKDSILESSGVRYGVSTPNFRPSLPQQDHSSPLKPQTAARQPSFRPPTMMNGGSLGIYNHARSPLRKSASTNFASTKHGYADDAKRDRAPGSPEKRIRDRNSTPAGGFSTTNAGIARYEKDKHERSKRETGNF